MLNKTFSCVDEVIEKIGFPSYKCKTLSRVVFLMSGSPLDKEKILFMYMNDVIEKISFPSYICKTLSKLILLAGMPLYK